MSKLSLMRAPMLSACLDSLTNSFQCILDYVVLSPQFQNLIVLYKRKHSSSKLKIIFQVYTDKYCLWFQRAMALSF